jgi:hypothetical protein
MGHTLTAGDLERLNHLAGEAPDIGEGRTTDRTAGLQGVTTDSYNRAPLLMNHSPCIFVFRGVDAERAARRLFAQIAGERA